MYYRPKVSVQKVVIIPKSWAPYFMEPQSLWRVLYTFKTFMREIPDNIKDSFEFIEGWISVSCTHEAKKDESALCYSV